MPVIHINLDKRSYSIIVGNKILRDLGNLLSDFNLSSKAVIITNPRVGRLYLKPIKESLLNKGFDVSAIIIPDGEKSKNYRQLIEIYRNLISARLDRRSLIIGLGGGVIGDISGFAAATFMRGIPYVQVPTSLLAQVDSSIGGKTAINLGGIKNIIGSFYQPKLVYTDISSLRTLPREELYNGLAEVIKYGVIKDERFFQYLEKNIEKVLELDTLCLEKIVFRCAQIKAEIVEEDEREEGIRAILNYGHTLGHCFETITKFRYRHGQAISLGMIYISEIAQRLGILEKKDAERQKRLLQRGHLPVSLRKSFNPEEILTILEMDKKRRGGRQRFILPRKIGEVIIKEDIPRELIKEALLS
ncbi:MAG: 3-dehydroquinate synthase [Candidatus Omnitrophica bacterium]|nr:3-dehydroquinate synthase [Candidatus Omnitrophota bacterium]